MKLSIFISSPGDVGEERRLAGRILDRLSLEFAGRVGLEPLFWEHEPLRATSTFQEQIPLPSESDVVIVILWSRLGTRLPEHIVREDGTPYDSGTEFEFEDAARAFRTKGLPDLLVYRKTARPVTPLDSEAEVLERLRQKRALDAFVERWFQGADGSFQAAFHAFETPAAFEELLEAHLRRLLERRLAEKAEARPAAEAAPLWTRGSPFRGLEAFEYEHATVFCGRTRAVSEVLDRLRRQAAEARPFLVVLGMSGCGKSSLVRAGVLPQLTTPGVIEGIGLWRRAVLHPGNDRDPFRALAAALLAEEALPELALGTDVDALAADLRASPRSVGSMIRQTLAQAAAKVQAEESLDEVPEARLALVVDQFEELFTLAGVTTSDRQAFVEALGALADTGKVWILATLRSDFYDRAVELPALVALKEGAGQYDLLPPTPAEIGQMIRLPARMAGLAFEEEAETDAHLDDVLRDAAAKDPEALPLLEFALDALYEQRTETGLLTFEAYGALGGLEGALASRAEATFAALPAAVQAAAPHVFESLVRFGLDDKENAVRRRAAREATAPTPEAAALVDAFVEARLFAADRAADGTPEVTLAHEALLRHWPRLRAWVDANRERLRSRARLAAAAAIWEEEEEASEHLLGRGHLLEEGAALLTERRAELPAREVRFLEASLDASRRSRRRKRLGVAAVLAVVLLAAVGAWRYYDANVRVHVEHFADAVHRWGVPTPIGDALGGEALRRRARAFRIRHQGGRVLETAIVRGSGALLTEHEGGSLIGRFDPEAGTQRECVWEYRYFEDGAVSDEIARNQYGQVVHHLRFPQDHRGRTTTIAQYVSEGLPSSQTPSGAAFVEIGRDERGFRTSMRYIDHERRSLPNENGSHGERWENDARGLVVRIVNLGREGAPHPDRRGVTQTVIERDALGRQVRLAFQDPDGRPVTLPEGFAGFATRYDAWGNPARVAYFDAAGGPVRSTHGWASVERTYDDRGHFEAEAYFDADGEPIDGSWGPALVRMETDDRGEITEWACFDAAGEPTWGAAGFFASITRVERDDYGNALRLLNYGVDGQPAAHSDGNHGYEAEFDERGNRVAIRYVDARGGPTRLRGGYAEIRTVYDERNHPIETTYCDLDGAPVRARGGFAIQREARDARGNKNRVTYHHPDGSPAVSDYGNAAFEADYDDFNQLVEERYLGCDGELIRLPGGFAAIRNRYDDRGRKLEVTTLDRDGNAVRANTGYATVRHVYDDRGLVAETRYFAADASPTRSTEGIAGFRLVRDAHGRVLEKHHLAPDGTPTRDDEGVAIVKSTYDGRGREIGRRFDGVDGKPTVHGTLGAAGWIAAYDAGGNAVRRTYLGRDGKPAFGREGYVTVERRYDGRHLLVEEAFQDAAGQPVYDRNGAAIVRYERNERDQVTHARYLDASGEPVHRVDGYAEVSGTYDRHGDPLTKTWQDVEGNPVQREDGLAGWRATYDDRGWLATKVFLGAELEPVRDASGCAGFARTYDRNGNVTETRWLDPEGAPCVRVEGYAIERNVYDENGDLLVTTVHDVAGEPALLPDGSHGKRLHREEKGRVVVETSIDAAGEPTARAGGQASIRNVYDERGRWVLVVYEDLHGDAVDPGYGFAGLRSTYDDWDREIAITILGPEEGPIAGPNGYAIEEHELDAWGRRVETRRLDGDGEVLPPPYVPAVVRRSFDDHGNETQVAIHASDGTPTVEASGIHATRRRYDASGNMVREAFLGPDGEAVTAPNEGWSYATYAYDERHNQTEARYFDAEGGAIAPPASGHVVRRRYDATRQSVDVAHFGVDEKPVAVAALGGDHRHAYEMTPSGRPVALTAYAADGTHRSLRLDETGRIVERSYFEASGSRAAGPLGFAQQVWTGDTDRPYRFLDARGREIEVDLEVFVAGLAPEGTALRLGLQQGDVVEQFDGRAVPDDLTLRAWLLQETQGARPMTIVRDGRRVEVQVPPGPLGVFLEAR